MAKSIKTLAEGDEVKPKKVTKPKADKKAMATREAKPLKASKPKSTSLPTAFSEPTRDELREMLTKLDGLKQNGRKSSNAVKNMLKEFAEQYGVPVFIAKILDSINRIKDDKARAHAWRALVNGGDELGFNDQRDIEDYIRKDQVEEAKATKPELIDGVEEFEGEGA